MAEAGDAVPATGDETERQTPNDIFDDIVDSIDVSNKAVQTGTAKLFDSLQGAKGVAATAEVMNVLDGNFLLKGEGNEATRFLMSEQPDVGWCIVDSGDQLMTLKSFKLFKETLEAMKKPGTALEQVYDSFMQAMESAGLTTDGEFPEHSTSSQWFDTLENSTGEAQHFYKMFKAKTIERRGIITQLNKIGYNLPLDRPYVYGMHPNAPKFFYLDANFAKLRDGIVQCRERGCKNYFTNFKGSAIMNGVDTIEQNVAAQHGRAETETNPTKAAGWFASENTNIALVKAFKDIVVKGAEIGIPYYLAWLSLEDVLKTLTGAGGDIPGVCQAICKSGTYTATCKVPTDPSVQGGLPYACRCLAGSDKAVGPCGPNADDSDCASADNAEADMKDSKKGGYLMQGGVCSWDTLDGPTVDKAGHGICDSKETGCMYNYTAPVGAGGNTVANDAALSQMFSSFIKIFQQLLPLLKYLPFILSILFLWGIISRVWHAAAGDN